MCTHKCGYKFYVSVSKSSDYLYVNLFSVPGEFDGQLNWPAKTKFTIELINQHGGKNAVYTGNVSWRMPIHASSTNLVNNTLYFYISKVEVL